MPVSYTHLDVYKRQVQELVAKGGRGSGKSSYISIELVLQLLAYYVSCAKGLDVDKPRNLARMCIRDRS